MGGDTMVHFIRICFAVGLCALLAAAVVGTGMLFGIKPTFPCTHHDYKGFTHIEREGVCTL